MSKRIIRINASALKNSTCMLHFYRTVIQGYKEPVNNNDIEFGTAVHLFIKTMCETGGRFDLAIKASGDYWNRTKMIIKPKKQYLNLFHLNKVCIETWNYIQNHSNFDILTYKEECKSCAGTGNVSVDFDDERNPEVTTCLVCNGLGRIDKPAVEMTFSNHYYEDDDVIIYLEGTLDKLGKIKDGCYAVGDYKTTASWNKEEYLSGYDLSTQLRFYVFNMKLIAQRQPDSLIGQLCKYQLGAFIEGIFLQGKDKTEFGRSTVYIFSDEELAIYKKLLDAKIQTLLGYIKTNTVPPPEGILLDICGEGKFGKCKFCHVCMQPDEVSQNHILNDPTRFIQEEYKPLEVGKDR